jgi:hypothetical protein
MHPSIPNATATEHDTGYIPDALLSKTRCTFSVYFTAHGTRGRFDPEIPPMPMCGYSSSHLAVSGLAQKRDLL